MKLPTSLARAAVLGVALWSVQAASAALIVNGVLPTNSGQSIKDTDLAAMFGKYFPKDSSGNVKSDILIVFGQCYGGDFPKLFDSTLNDPTAPQGATADTVGFTNATVLTASSAGQTSDFNGWGSGSPDKTSALDKLAPGNTAQDVVDAGAAAKAPTEHPTQTGSLTKTIGGPNSTHVVIYAGKPLTENDDSRPEIKKVRDHFSGMANTTVDVVAGDGSMAQTGVPGAKPATFSALDALLKQIGQNVMQDGEQFILYVADHGEENRASFGALVVPGAGTQSVSLDTGELQGDALYAAGADPTYGGATISFDSAQVISNPSTFNIAFGSHILGTLGQSAVGTVILPDGTAAFQYTLPVPLSVLNAGSTSAEIGIIDSGSLGATFDDIVFDSGAIPQTDIPEPMSAAILVVPAVLLGRRRGR
jgi:hypothetical protein